MAKITRKGQKAKAWKACSLYIRQKYADDNGYVSCVTCGTTKHYTEMDAGHFIPKSRGNAIYFVEENIHPQCKGCNMCEGGRFEDYYPYMVSMYGQSGVDELTQRSKAILKLSIKDLEEIETYYKEALNDLHSQ